LVSQTIPAAELAKVHVYDLELLDILESKQGDGSIKGKLLIPFDQSCPVIWSKSQGGQFGES